MEMHLADLEDLFEERKDRDGGKKTKFICGDEPSLCDLTWAVLFYRLDQTGFLQMLYKQKGALKSYYSYLKQLPSFKRVLSQQRIMESQPRLKLALERQKGLFKDK